MMSHSSPAPASVPFVDADLQRYAARVRDEFAERVVPVEDRELVRQSYSLRRFYEEWLLPERLVRRDSGQLSRGSIEKDRQALNRWEKFTRPPASEWPKAKPWSGLPIGYITGRYLDQFVRTLNRSLAESTVHSTWTHLRTMLNAACKLRALDVAPSPTDAPQMRKAITKIYPLDLSPTGTLTAMYRALKDNRPLQTAFVLALNAGMRPIDLFLLQWDQFDFDANTVEFHARKSKKTQRIPLAECTRAHVARLGPRKSGPVFPDLSTDCKKPEKSRPARRRRTTFRELIVAAGLECPGKPFQVARATCNERYESHANGVGPFILGHGLTLNSRSYREPSDHIREAVATLPQPACFHEIG